MNAKPIYKPTPRPRNHQPKKDNVAQQAKISLTYQVVLFPSQGGFSNWSHSLIRYHFKGFDLIGREWNRHLKSFER